MIFKKDKQQIMDLIEMYGDLREHYGRNSAHWIDFEKTEENHKIGKLFGAIETILTCAD